MITTKSLIRISAFGLLGFAILGTPVQAQNMLTDTITTNSVSGTNAVKKVKHKKKKVADTNAPAMTAPIATPAAATPTEIPAAATNGVAKAGHNKSGVLPFHGKLKAVDAAGGTISVGTRTFEINSETIIIKNGKPATLADGVVGDETGGAYKKTADGKLVITKLRFGAKTTDESAK
jgi:hypothetical protein